MAVGERRGWNGTVAGWEATRAGHTQRVEIKDTSTYTTPEGIFAALTVMSHGQCIVAEIDPNEFNKIFMDVQELRKSNHEKGTLYRSYRRDAIVVTCNEK